MAGGEDPNNGNGPMHRGNHRQGWQSICMSDLSGILQEPIQQEMMFALVLGTLYLTTYAQQASPVWGTRAVKARQGSRKQCLRILIRGESSVKQIEEVE